MSVLLFLEDGKSPLESLIMTSESKFELRNGALCTMSTTTRDEKNQRKYSSDNDESVVTGNSDSPSENELSDCSRRRASAPPMVGSSSSSFSSRSTEPSRRSICNARPITDPRDSGRRVYSKNERQAIQRSEQKTFSQQAATSIVHHGFYV